MQLKLYLFEVRVVVAVTLTVIVTVTDKERQKIGIVLNMTGFELIVPNKTGLVQNITEFVLNTRGLNKI